MMEKIRKLFGSWGMSWKKVILLAVISAVLTAVFNLIPLFENTSFTDPAVYPDLWFLFAIVIVMNCEKWYEAALKCFVFFLVSQPLIYLIEVPFSADGFGIFRYYKYWFMITMLTLPGAAIAFFVKKKNMLSALILSVATGYLAWASVRCLKSVIISFPRHLISLIFCLGFAAFLLWFFLEKKGRILAGAITVCVLAFFLVRMGTQLRTRIQTIDLGAGNWTCEMEGEKNAELNVIGEGQVQIRALKEGTTVVTFTSEDGTEKVYTVTVYGGSMTLDEITD